MSDLSGPIGARVITDLDELAECRSILHFDHGIRMPLQDAEAEAGLTEADNWKFLYEPAYSVSVSR